MSLGHVSCRGCAYSGAPHNEDCPEAAYNKYPTVKKYLTIQTASTELDARAENVVTQWKCSHGKLASETCSNCGSFYGGPERSNNIRWMLARDSEIASLRSQLARSESSINTAREHISALEKELENRKQGEK